MTDTFTDFMLSPEMRAEFPDPQQRKAAWKAREQIQPVDIYSIAKDALSACCAKQDIPQVQAVIALLQGPLERFWADHMQDALDAATARLTELEDDLPTPQVDGVVFSESPQRDEALLVAAFLSVLDRAASAPLSARLENLLGRATEGLLRDGASSQNLGIDLAREPLVRSAARDDLRTLIAGRIVTRRTELQDQAKEFLRSKRARTPARPGDITQAAEGFRARSLQEWVTRSVGLVGLRTATWLPVVVDQWAYRWFVVGQFLSGRQAGFTELRARAVLDDRTTPFCQWVNGRVISTARATNQLDRHVRASIQEDVQGLVGNWPMLPNGITQASSVNVFRRGFARVGLPPYHFRCRTTVQWIRTGLGS